MRQSCHRLLEHQQAGVDEPPLYSPLDQISGKLYFIITQIQSTFQWPNSRSQRSTMCNNWNVRFSLLFLYEAVNSSARRGRVAYWWIAIVTYL